MPLARIITRSEICSQELTRDLLARGYEVEVVFPDEIRTNPADLELRVDAIPGDRLVANVTANNGGRVTSAEFVQRLKRAEESSADESKFQFELGAEAPSHGSLRAAAYRAAANRIAKSGRAPSRLKAAFELKNDDLGEWLWRGSLTAAAVLLLAIVVTIGRGHSALASSQNSNGHQQSSPQSSKKTNAVVPPQPIHRRGLINNDGTLAVDAAPAASQPQDLIAPNSVVYLDPRFDKTARPKLSRGSARAMAGAGSGVVQASSVTRLNPKAATAPANP